MQPKVSEKAKGSCDTEQCTVVSLEMKGNGMEWEEFSSFFEATVKDLMTCHNVFSRASHSRNKTQKSTVCRGKIAGHKLPLVPVFNM